MFDCVRWVYKYKNIEPQIIKSLINKEDVFSLECGEKNVIRPDNTIKYIKLANGIESGYCACLVQIDGSKQYFVDGKPVRRKTYIKLKKEKKRLVK